MMRNGNSMQKKMDLVGNHPQVKTKGDYEWDICRFEEEEFLYSILSSSIAYQ
jgi:hypothetical protein